MTHIRTQIRAALAAALEAHAPVGWVIERSRDREIDLEEMPRVLIGIHRETALPTGDCLPLTRVMAAEVTAHVAVAREFDIEDALDAASGWIEQAVAADGLLGGLVRETTYRGADLELITGGDRPAGRITLAFDIRT